MRLPAAIGSVALLATVALVGIAGAARAAGDPPSAPRPLVLLVHGRGHAGLDTSALRRSWQQALNDGARAASGHAPLGDSDVSLVWYADALDPMSPERCTPEQIARSRRALPATDELGAVLGFAGLFLAAVVHDDASEGARELRNFASDLQYFGDVEKRCASEQRLAAALVRAERERRPVILVAHSMGAILSWSYLHGRAAGSTDALPEIRRFVTLGSPVGSSDIRRLLLGNAAAIALPPKVDSWINIVDERDPFAVPLGVRGSGLLDVRTHTDASGDPHEVTRYLRDPATTSAVLGAWCAAFGQDVPDGCSTLAKLEH